jgi:hypothetical protein
MNDRSNVRLLVCAVGVALFAAMVLAVSVKLRTPVFLPGGIGSIVALYVLGERLWRR